jgi:uncharacterized protein involved in outer membrane biogenesis
MSIGKIIKITLITAISVFIIAIVAAVALVVWVKPNAYKPIIIKQVKNMTGRELELTGDISWKFFPNIGLHIGHASLSNPQGFIKPAKNSPTANLQVVPDFMKLDSMDVTIQLMPLLNKNIIIDQVVVNGLNIALISSDAKNNAGNTNNWSFTTKNSESNTFKDNYNDSKLADITLNMSEFALHDATISYINLSGGKINMRKSLRNFDFKVSKAHNGVINFDKQAKVLNLDKVEVNFDDIVSGVLNLQVTDAASVKYAGSISIRQFSLNKLLVKLGHAVPDIPNKSLLNKVALTANFNGNKGSLRIPNMRLNVSDSAIKAVLNVSSFAPLNLNNQIYMDKIDLSDVIDTDGYRLPIRDVRVMGSLHKNGSSSSDMNQSIMIQNVTVLGFDVDDLLHKIDEMLIHGASIPKTNDLVEQIKSGVRVISLVQNMRDLLDQAKKSGNKNWDKKTDLGKFTGSVVDRGGVINPSSFVLNGAKVKISGNGEVNLNNKTLDYRITSQIIEPQKSKLLNQMSFPYHMYGNLAKPDGNLDWNSIQKQVVAYYIANNREMIKNNIKETINNQINNQINGQNKNKPDDNTQKAINNIVKNLFK